MAYSYFRPWRRRAAVAMALPTLASSLLTFAPNAVPLRADVVGIGDITPAIPNPDPPPTDLVPDLPVSGGFREIVVVGGTGQFVGGTSAGQMTIDIPGDTDPLVSDSGAIGYLQDGQGTVRVLGLNSEWRVNDFLHVGVLGQGALQISAGARVGNAPNAAITEQMAIFVGYGEGSQGFVTVDGFISLMKSYTLSVGRAGSGNLTVTNGGRIETTFEAQIGGDAFVQNSTDTDLINGVGLVTLDGQATRWNVGIPVPTGQTPPGLPLPPPSNTGQVADLYIGKAGRGNLQIQNQAWARVSRDIYIGDDENSYGAATVTGLGSTMWALRDLNVGNDQAGANLNIDDQGLVRVDDDVVIGTLGYVNMGGGTLLTNPDDGSITNDGVIRGDGRIDTGTGLGAGLVTNNGYIRNGASVANLRERLLFTGPVTNTNNIESVGGEIEFQGPLVNSGPDGEIVGINAIYRFNGGLFNTGSLYFKNSLVWYGATAPATVTTSANLVIQEGETQFMGNLTMTAANTFSVEVGHTSSLLTVSGNTTLAGTLLVTGVDGLLGEGSSDGWAPNIGDSFEILASENLAGTFADVDDFYSDFDFEAVYDYLAGSVLLNVVASATTFNADFNGNGTVDGFDFMTWQANRGTLVGATQMTGDADGDGNVDDTDYQIWKDQFGGPPPVVVAAGAVPEPATAVLALAALSLPLAARRRRS